MKERPILFSGPMVRAILEGRKTQTRRVVKPNRSAPTASHVSCTPASDGSYWVEPGGWVACPYGKPGDRLWVRETILRIGDRSDPICASIYAADGSMTPADAWPWKADRLPSIHCPRGLSRITLEVISVRVERLQAISNEDAKAEGVREYDGDEPGDYRGGFRDLWQSINGKRPGCSWDDNPWVWAIEFKVVTP